MRPSIRRALVLAAAFWSVVLIALPAWSQPVIVSAGATLVAESLAPANGLLDPTEVVTVSHCIQNTGDTNTTNLVGTLQATGGVTSPSGPQNYGAVVAGGSPVCRNFTYTATGSPGGSLTASIQFQDGANDLGTVTYQFTLAAPCAITCPANVTASNDLNQCGAVVAFAAPTTTGSCGAVSAAPASSSFFPVGTTTVTATAAGGPSCTFTVTVQDTQPPQISCPVAIAQLAPVGQSSAVITFNTTATDNCPSTTVQSVPPSGSIFAAGTTIDTSTATDASGNTATCSFNIAVVANLPQVPIPTLSNAALLLLGLGLVFGGAYAIRRRKLQ